MARRLLLLALPLLLVAILALARASAPTAGGESLDARAFGIRVEMGEGARVPAELTTALAGWPTVAPLDPAEVELGRLLFFDPTLSGSRTVSCASCHHPELGLADGRALGVGVSGEPTRRNAPALWNLAYRERFNWDGRAPSLEAQMLQGPVIHPDEMANNPAELLDRLAAIPGYRERFEPLYGEVTLEGMAAAIAAFERSLISRDSPVDRYAAGDYYAINGAARRGVTLFSSPEANCIACHEPPLFGNEEPKVIGVRDRAGVFDPGVGEVTGRPQDGGAFLVPSLRNVELTAPYFHSGLEPDLVSAISFYVNGGGDNLDVPRGRLSSELRPFFDVQTRSLRDLEAFLIALTDNSGLPEPPSELPSGIAPSAPPADPVEPRLDSVLPRAAGPPESVTVEPGRSVQATIDRARPGDTIILAPGRYFEALDIDVEGLTLRGEGATLVGRRFTPVGITVRHNDVTIEGLAIEGFARYPIVLEGARDLRLAGVTIEGREASGVVGAVEP